MEMEIKIKELGEATSCLSAPVALNTRNLSFQFII